jgi:hypothetical protein
MSEMLIPRIAVGDEVRVHFHPPGPWRSFSEGVVKQVNVITPEGRFFVLEVRNEVLFDKPHRIMPNFRDYIRYECRNDFSGRIEVLTTAEPNVEKEPTSAQPPVKCPGGPTQAAEEQHLGELDVRRWNPETERMPELEVNYEPAQVDVGSQPIRKQRGLLAALLGRRE